MQCNTVLILVFLSVYFIDYAITVVPVFPPLPLSTQYHPSLQHSSHPLSSCPWVVHVSSLASPFPILFLTSPCLFCTYHFYFLFPVPFPPFFPFLLPADNSPNDLHAYDCVPVLAVCLIYICFCFLDLIVDSCDFVVMLMFIILIFFLS